MLGVQTVQAGAQIEEPLADSVRSALSAAIANHAAPVPEFADTATRMRYLRWIGVMGDRLKNKKTEWPERKDFLQTLWYESARAGLDAHLILGLVQVESNFRKYAVSSAGARGYMQIMPFWSRLIGDADISGLFHVQTNLRFGCVILRHYLEQERGDLVLALGRYNGSRGQTAYPKAVLAARDQWELASRFNPG
ncbi:MAG: transglycosylase SLT domain-containing protein [Burkholderiaceae bacterium]